MLVLYEGNIRGRTPLLMPRTCSGVAVMGPGTLGMWGICVAVTGAVLAAGLGSPPAGEAGALYFSMAGSTSGTPWEG